MKPDISGWATIVGAFVTLVLLGSGLAMVESPPSPADAAVGKGLLVLGLCAGIVTTALLAYAVSTAPRSESTPAARNDWDEA